MVEKLLLKVSPGRGANLLLFCRLVKKKKAESLDQAFSTNQQILVRI
jgi:hypothetical protein